MDTSELPFPFSLLFQHTWLLFIIVTCINAFSLKFQSKKYVEQNPSLEDDYEKIFRGYLFYLNIPWVIMGIGMIFGDFKSIFDFLFGIRSGNPFILLFFGSVIALWVIAVVWIYFQGGAEFLIEHPSILRTMTKSPIEIKIYVALMLLGGIFGLAGMWTVGSFLP